MKVDKFSLEDVFPSEDGSLKLILIDREGDKHILHYPKSYEHVYFNDMYFFMNQGYIVLGNDCVPVNPIILTPECDGKFAVIKENEPAKFIKYHAGCELGYEIDGNLYDPFGHARPLPTERTTLSPDYQVKYVISERGTNYFSSTAIVNLKAYNKLRGSLLNVTITKIGKAQHERLKHTKTNFKITT